MFLFGTPYELWWTPVRAWKPYQPDILSRKWNLLFRLMVWIIKKASAAEHKNKYMLVGFASSSTDAQHREQKFKDKSAKLCNMNAEMVWILLWIQSSRMWTYWLWLVLTIILYTMMSMKRSGMIWMNGPCAKGVWKGAFWKALNKTYLNSFHTFPARVEFNNNIQNKAVKPYTNEPPYYFCSYLVTRSQKYLKKSSY